MKSRTRLTLLLGLLLWLPGAWAAAQDGQAWSVRGQWQQGELLLGRAAPGTQVWFNGRKLSLTPQGDFVFGLDRDAPAEAELRVQTPQAPMPETFRYAVAPRAWDVQRVDGLPESKVNPPPAALKRIERERALIAAARAPDRPLENFAQPMQWPVLGRISGVFGNQRILNGVPKQPHYGVDVAVPTGTRLMAPLGGIVTLAERDLYFTGGTVIIDHGHGLSSIMVHLSKVGVKNGQALQQGEYVGDAGMTGRATGPHLHWGVYWFGARLDPQRLLPPMETLWPPKTP